jgi:phospholipid/cholesterol/gamma-HCH transport system permease protein
MRILVGAMTDFVSNPVTPHSAARIELARARRSGELAIGGAWQLDADLPDDLDRIDAELLAEQGLTSIAFETSDLGAWDSGLVSYLASLVWRCRERGIEVQEDGLPEGIQALLRLASTVPQRRADGHDEHADPFLQRFGQDFIDLARSTGEILAFVGEVTLACGRCWRGGRVFGARSCGC